MPLPLKYNKLKNEVLGEAYDLSFALIDSIRSHELNLNYRGKDKPANVLSFPFSPSAGEILIDRELVPEPAEQLYMFIHGLLHLAGLDHGSIMEAEEERLLARYSTHHGKHHRRGPRHRELEH